MFLTQMSVFQKVFQLPMSYDCLTHMLTHPLRDYMFGLRGGLFRRGLTRSLRGSIRYCPHRNCLREPFVASFPFILAFCAFHNFNVWFVLLRGQWLLPPYLQKRGGPMAGAISCLRGAYAEVTRRLRGFHLHYVVGNFSIYNPLNGSFLVLPFLFTSSFLQSSGILPNLSDLTRETLRNMLANKKLMPAYADLSFPYAGRPYDKAPT